MVGLDETSFFGLEQGCPIHGDDYMRECSVCGAEYCRLCHPGGTMCPDCAAEEEEDDFGGDTREIEEPDFEDVEDLKDILADEDMDFEEIQEEEDGAENKSTRPAKQSRSTKNRPRWGRKKGRK